MKFSTLFAIIEQVFINEHQVVLPHDIHTENGVIHSLDGSLNPIINRCDTMNPSFESVYA
jgi:hypothetical protein